MPKGIYEYTSQNGDEARWVREPDGCVRYWLNGQWEMVFSPNDWRKLVTAMTLEPLRSDEIPIMGEIIGWRCWRHFSGGNHLLWSFHKRHCWLPGEIQEGHVGDDVGGIYAFKTKSHAVSEALNDEWDRPIVVGSVRLWGDAIEATDGWRAEYAKINSLDYVFFSPLAKKNYLSPQRFEKRIIRRFGGLIKQIQTVAIETTEDIDETKFLTMLKTRYLPDRPETASIMRR